MLSFVKDVSIIIAGLVTLITFMTGVVQYVRQGRQMRASQFIEMRRRFLEESSFRGILNLLATDDVKLKETPIQERRNLVGFLEEVALMVNSGILKPEVAHYMFGYYVLLVDGSENFWHGLNKDSEYWSLFHAFARTMMLQKVVQTSEGKALKF